MSNEEMVRIIRDNRSAWATNTEHSEMEAAQAAAILAAGYRKPRVVTTSEEVYALAEGAVLMDSAGDVAQLRGGLWCGYEASPMAPQRQAKYLPSTVLHEGGAQK